MKQRLIPILVFLIVAGIGGGLIWTFVFRSGETAADHRQDHAEPHGPAETDGAAEPSHVELSTEQSEVAKIATAAVVRATLQPERTVPGRLTYDDTRHIEVRVPTSGTLREILVKPGDSVTAGTVLARISSPEVGLARADVLRRDSELKLATVEWDRNRALCEGLKNLVDAVQRGDDAAHIIEETKGVRLGPYRERIVAAYSRLNLARQLFDNLRNAAETGAVAARTLQEREGEKTTATAALKGVIEESLYEAERACATSELAAMDAQRRWRIARQHLETLLGYDEPVRDADDGPPLSLVEVRAPFAGTVETKNYSQSERVDAGDSLFVLADTTHLWVAADIREKEWSALRLEPGAPVTVTSPALGDRTLTAQLYFLGRVVSPETNAVPLIATIANDEGLLRPGQFVRVRLPTGEPRSGPAVPDSAIAEHERQAFVFVPDGPHRFRRVNVVRGFSANGLTLIESPLDEGDQVVSRGVFTLKSQLLLEREE